MPRGGKLDIVSPAEIDMEENGRGLCPGMDVNRLKKNIKNRFAKSSSF